MPHIAFAGTGFQPLLSLPVHHHEPWIVICYNVGIGEAIFDDVRLPFQRGTVLCVPPRMPYAETSRKGFNSIFIAVDKLQMDVRRPHVFFDGSGQWLRMAGLIAESFNAAGPRSRLVAEKMLDALLLSLLPSSEPPLHPQVERLREIIHQRWADPDFQIVDAMSEIPVSPAHLRRTFASAMSAPPVNYLLQHRIQHAQQLLGIGGFSVKEVSRMCGFRDPYYFSRAFRRISGRPPTEWKRRG